jgi:hypothetical protein
VVWWLSSKTQPQKKVLDKLKKLCYNESIKRKELILMKMLWMMFVGLFSYWKFENKEEFWEWYWERNIDPRYPNETLWDEWDTFKYEITLGHLRWEMRMWYNQHFGKKYFGYSWTFNKNGYFVKDWKTNGWWFIPDDGSFSHGSVADGKERDNGNPIFC